VYDYLKERDFILTQHYSQFGFHTSDSPLENLWPEDMLEWQKKLIEFLFRRVRLSSR